MKTPQLEDGFFRTANELGEAFSCAEWLCARSRVMFLLLRICYGTFQKRQKNPITVTEFVASNVANRTGLSLSEAKRTIKELVDGGVISVIKASSGRTPAVYGIQKDYLKWVLPNHKSRRSWPGREHHEFTSRGPVESTTIASLWPSEEHHKNGLPGPQRDAESTTTLRRKHHNVTQKAPQITSKPALLSQKTPLVDRDRDRDNTPSLRSGDAGGENTDLYFQCMQILAEIEFGLPGLTQQRSLKQFLKINFTDEQKIGWLRLGVEKVKSLYGVMEIENPSGFAIKHAGRQSLKPTATEREPWRDEFENPPAWED